MVTAERAEDRQEESYFFSISDALVKVVCMKSDMYVLFCFFGLLLRTLIMLLLTYILHDIIRYFYSLQSIVHRVACNF